jgi:acyl dehydratase
VLHAWRRRSRKLVPAGLARHLAAIRSRGYEELASFSMSESESMLFNAIVLDMHPYVADDVFAKEGGMFGKRLVAGAWVLA